jgi:quinoprotein relay system zinc metallohydrolase 2
MRYGMLVSAIALCFVAGAASAAPLQMQEIAPGLYVHHGVTEEATPANEDGIANIGFIVGSSAVLVIDPGGSAIEGEQLHEAVRAVTDRPIRYVVMTHVHPDHIFGAAAFKDDHPEFIGHTMLPGALAQRGDYYLRNLRRALGETADGSEVVVPTRLIETRTEIEIDLGNRPVEIRAHGPAHTDNDLTLLDRQTATLWMADLLFVERIPAIDGSIVGWVRELDEMMKVPAQRAVPGHGPVSVAWPAAAEPELHYLHAVLDGTRLAIKQGIDIGDAWHHVALEERSHWALFDEYHPRNVTTAYKELEWE